MILEGTAQVGDLIALARPILPEEIGMDMMGPFIYLGIKSYPFKEVILFQCDGSITHELWTPFHYYYRILSRVSESTS